MTERECISYEDPADSLFSLCTETFLIEMAELSLHESNTASELPYSSQETVR